MPVWYFTQQLLIMERQHQDICIDIYLQDVERKTRKKASVIQTNDYISICGNQQENELNVA